MDQQAGALEMRLSKPFGEGLGAAGGSCSFCSSGALATTLDNSFEIVGLNNRLGA